MVFVSNLNPRILAASLHIDFEELVFPPGKTFVEKDSGPPFLPPNFNVHIRMNRGHQVPSALLVSDKGKHLQEFQMDYAIYRQSDWCFHNHGFWCWRFNRRANAPIPMNIGNRYASLTCFRTVTEKLNPSIETTWERNFANFDFSIAESDGVFSNIFDIKKLNLHLCIGVRD